MKLLLLTLLSSTLILTSVARGENIGPVKVNVTVKAYNAKSADVVWGNHRYTLPRSVFPVGQKRIPTGMVTEIEVPPFMFNAMILMASR